MDIPNLTKQDVECIIPSCKVIGEPLEGGQKLVFPCIYKKNKCAVKFILLNGLKDDLDGDIQSKIDTIQARVEREISIMREINSPNVIKIGDIPLTSVKYHDQSMLYYSEEWIEGSCLQDILIAENKLSVYEVTALAIDIVGAISELWNLNKVHRDIKPLNIMRVKSNGKYVLLDFGLAFDLDDKSLTQVGCVPGTKIYFSPEQLDIMHKRDIDFRSDLFSLGMVLYQALTGHHPFYKFGMQDDDLFYSIIRNPITQPIDIVKSIPPELNTIVCRLLNKQPSGRYRKCSILLDELGRVMEKLEMEV